MRKFNKSVGVLSLALMVLGTGCENKGSEQAVQPKVEKAEVKVKPQVQTVAPKAAETANKEVSPLDTDFIALEKKKNETKKMMMEYQNLRSQVGQLYRSGQQPKAEQMIQKIKDLESKLKPAIDDYKSKSKAFTDKLAKMYTAKQLEPKFMQMYAFMLGDTGNFKTQVEVLSELNQNSPFDIRAFMAYINACEKTNQLGKAVQSIKSRLADTKLAPAEKSELELLLAQNLFFTQEFDEAAKMFEELSKDPEKAAKLAGLKQNVIEYKELWKKEQEYRKNSKDLPVVMIRTNKGDMKFELFEDDAPNAVANFITLVESGFYNGQNFHRVIPKFMAQGGDPLSKDDIPQNDGTGGPGYKIKTELSKRKHFQGVLSYANSGIDTDGSQFFITVIPTFWLNGKHAVFGRILEGMDIANGLEKGDQIRSIDVIKKRDHVYKVTKL